MTATAYVEAQRKRIYSAVSSVKRCKPIWITRPTRLFENHFYIEKKQKILNTYTKRLLVDGYIRLVENKEHTLMIPQDIIQLISYFSDQMMDRIEVLDGTYSCTQKSTQKQFAVKILNKNKWYRIPRKYRSRYMRAMADEFEILECSHHSNIVNIEHMFEGKHSTYLVLKKCKGETLLQRIIERGPFTEYDASKVIKQVLRALHWTHTEHGIVHCDLNPENIYFVDKSDDLSIKIDGFGISKLLPRLRCIKQNSLGPTSYYTAPEIMKNHKYNHACDMWSVGVILYLMLFGYPPFSVDPEKYGSAEYKSLTDKIKRGFVPRVRSTEKHGFGSWFPDHVVVSVEVKHFISNLLVNTRKRYTAQDALSHPWIVNASKCVDVNNSKMHENVSMQSLAKFSNICQLKSNVITLFQEQFYNMRRKDFIELKALFIKMDTDNDGVICCEQLMNVISNMKNIYIDTKRMHLLFKSNYKSGIHCRSLLRGILHDYAVFWDRILYREFRKLDNNDDGRITSTQLEDTFKYNDILDEWNRGIEIIKTLECNGFIDYEEFLFHLHPNFEDDQLQLLGIDICDIQNKQKQKRKKKMKRRFHMNK